MSTVRTPEIPSPPELSAADLSSKATEEVRQLVAADDHRDLEFAERGFIATRKDLIIRRADGRAAFQEREP